ncbi:MAG: CBS domain-containing protein [Prolixibacteraceae bacterium]|nr:CBS domain-containing protein [Prolixibacteraceae bacterium]
MIAQELINNNLPVLNCKDTGTKALNIMESFKVSHLPVVSDDRYVGLVSDSFIYDRELEICALNEEIKAIAAPFVRNNQHLYEVMRVFNELKVTVLPVLYMDDAYCGAICIGDLTGKISGLFSVHEPGAVIVLELGRTDYSMSQIAQIVESNDAKILSLYTLSPENSMELDVTFKLNVTDVSSIIETFVRYDYTIKAVYAENSVLHDMFSERYDMFMKYINF